MGVGMTNRAAGHDVLGGWRAEGWDMMGWVGEWRIWPQDMTCWGAGT